MSDKKLYKKMVTIRQGKLIDFLNDNFKFGKLELKVHNSDPQDYIIREIYGKFDESINKDIDIGS